MSKSDFSNLPGVLAKMRKAVEGGIAAAAQDLVIHTTKRVSKGGGAKSFVSAPAGAAPYNQTGALMRGIGRTPVVGLACRVVSRARYSRMLERGGTIRARNKKYLPIPLNYEAKRMQQRLGAGGSLKSYKLDFIPGKPGGNPFLAKITGKGKRQRVKRLFVLKKSVRIKKHPFMKPSLEAMRGQIAARIRGTVRTIMGGYG